MPDETTILKFRDLLEKHGLTAQMMNRLHESAPQGDREQYRAGIRVDPALQPLSGETSTNELMGELRPLRPELDARVGSGRNAPEKAAVEAEKSTIGLTEKRMAWVRVLRTSIGQGFPRSRAEI